MQKKKSHGEVPHPKVTKLISDLGPRSSAPSTPFPGHSKGGDGEGPGAQVLQSVPSSSSTPRSRRSQVTCLARGWDRGGGWREEPSKHQNNAAIRRGQHFHTAVGEF